VSQTLHQGVLRRIPNTKVIEQGTKHFLGRAPKDQVEIRTYNQILATQGIRGFVSAMVNSMEYLQVFVCVYRRFPCLPAALPQQ